LTILNQSSIVDRGPFFFLHLFKYIQLEEADELDSDVAASQVQAVEVRRARVLHAAMNTVVGSAVSSVLDAMHANATTATATASDDAPR
jgi:hypothetical protein